MYDAIYSQKLENNGRTFSDGELVAYKGTGTCQFQNEQVHVDKEMIHEFNGIQGSWVPRLTWKGPVDLAWLWRGSF